MSTVMPNVDRVSNTFLRPQNSTFSQNQAENASCFHAAAELSAMGQNRLAGALLLLASAARLA